VGGIVLDLKGLNGTRLVAQAAASSLYVGYAGSNPQTIGSQSGYAAGLGSLGGGLASATARVTLFDGDSSPFDFDDGTQNEFFVNGISFGFFGNVATEITDSTGTAHIAFVNGFSDNQLNTGFFSITGSLSDLYTSLLGDTATFSLFDTDPFDNYYDFTAGVDGGLINVGTGPVVVPTTGVPEPLTMSLFGAGLVGIAAVRRRKKQAA